MWPRSRPVLVLAALAGAACGVRSEQSSGFGTLGGQALSSSTGETASSTTSGDGGSTSSSGSEGDGTSAGLVLDVGSKSDLMPPQPAGCQGKIDFLFMISGGQYMELLHTKLYEAFPEFIDTIQSKFADFDYHIMVVDGDGVWGHPTCPSDCNAECESFGFPCAALSDITACDQTLGAGVVFPAGKNAANEPCGLKGRRYLTKDDPELVKTFDCLVRVGESGGGALGNAFEAAMSFELTSSGMCNEGFLRKDALLFVAFVTATDDGYLGTPKEWAAAALAAKQGDPNAIVMFGIFNTIDQAWCESTKTHRICQLIRQFPHWSSVSADGPNFGAGFDAATDMLEEACLDFIPQ